MSHTTSSRSQVRGMGFRGAASLVPLAAAAAAALLLAVSPAGAQTMSGITVPGAGNPFLAGMPDGSAASGGDTAPDQSPVQVTGLNLTSGGYLTFSVTGSVEYGGGSPTDTPDGDPGFFYATGHGAENGLGGYTAPANSLVGVFLTNTEPDLSAAPDDLDFTSGSPDELGIDFATLSPQLKQVFFIGDGRTGNQTGALQQFFIPTGATRFYLGTVDGSGWFNNTGSFTVSATRVGGGTVAVPESGTLPLLSLGGSIPLMIGGIARRRRRLQNH